MHADAKQKTVVPTTRQPAGAEFDDDFLSDDVLMSLVP